MYSTSQLIMIKRLLIASPATDPTTAWSAPATTGAETARATQVMAAPTTSKCAPAASIWTALAPPGKILTPYCQNSRNYIRAYKLKNMYGYV